MSEDKHVKVRSLVSITDITPEELGRIGDLAYQYGQSPSSFAGALEGRRIGLIFTAPSTRTRVSFWSTATTLGCKVLHLGSTDLQTTTGETWRDTGDVLAHYLDGAVVRTNGPQSELYELASKLPATINALTHQEHPTQAFADLCALREQFGTAEGLSIAYLGQVNNTARALALLVCKTKGMKLDVYSPAGLGFDSSELDALKAISKRQAVRQLDRVPDSPDPVDAVYTTRWQSMGVPHKDPDWLSRFQPLKITESTMNKFSGTVDAIFMHDLPAVRDQEVSSDVLDGRASVVSRQAYHKSSAAAAALLWTLGEGARDH